jgi:excisionase family DNA binding protein
MTRTISQEEYLGYRREGLLPLRESKGMVMTVMEAAERIGISSSLIYELCRLGMIRHSRHGRPGKRGTIRISEDAVTNYLAACEQEPVLIGEDRLHHIR